MYYTCIIIHCQDFFANNYTFFIFGHIAQAYGGIFVQYAQGFDAFSPQSAKKQAFLPLHKAVNTLYNYT